MTHKAIRRRITLPQKRCPKTRIFHTEPGRYRVFVKAGSRTGRPHGES
jgi:hypothetical protein